MNAQFGLVNVWLQGDAVTRSVLLLLLAMSLSSWLVIVLKLLDWRTFSAQARRAQDRLANADAAPADASGDAADNLFEALASAGLKARQQYDQRQASGTLDLSDWLTLCLRRSIDESTARLQSYLALLASVGSTAPFVGLFGTVWGIYHALMSIGASGQATIDMVAGPIGEALIMTALGLAVAIPAVLGYNALVRANKSVLASLNRHAHDLHAWLALGMPTPADRADAVKPERKH